MADSTAPTTYVLDTSVLLSDPNAMSKFEEHAVVISLVVINELEAKRHHLELGWFARRALRNLEKMRVSRRSMTEPMQVNTAGGTVRIEINHQDRSTLPEAFRGNTNDHRILAVAHQINAADTPVVVVSKDLPLRLKAGVVGLAAEQYLREQASDGHHTGLVELSVDHGLIDELFAAGTSAVAAPDAELANASTNTNVILHSGSQSALARVKRITDGTAHLVRVEGDEKYSG